MGFSKREVTIPLGLGFKGFSRYFILFHSYQLGSGFRRDGHTCFLGSALYTFFPSSGLSCPLCENLVYNRIAINFFLFVI